MMMTCFWIRYNIDLTLLIVLERQILNISRCKLKTLL